MTSPEPRRRFNIGCWKLPFELRTLIHAIFNDLDAYLRSYRDILGADAPDYDEQFPVGSAVAYSVELTDAEAAEVAAASNLRYIEEDVLDPPHRAVGRPTGTAHVPTLATLAHMRARYVDLRRWHGRDVPVAVLDQGTTAAVREKMGYTLVARTVTGGVQIAPGEEIGRPVADHDHGCLVAPNAVPAGGQLLDCVIVEDNGRAFASAQAAGIRWAVDNGAKVVNLSFGGAPGTVDQARIDAATYAANAGVQIVISAGNEDLADLGVPASLSRTQTNVHSSIAFDESTDRRALFSNHHADGSGCAAGVDVDSFSTAGYPVTWNGTSASAPHMAQMIARGATGGQFTAAQVAAALRANTRDTGAGASEQGAGAWDLQRALAALGAIPATPSSAGVAAPSVVDAQGAASNGGGPGFTLTTPAGIVADDLRIVVVVASVNARITPPHGWAVLLEEHYYAGYEQAAGQTVGPTAVFVLAKPYVIGEPEPASLLFGSTWFSAMACLTVRAAGGLDPERFSPQVRFGTGSSIPTLPVLPATTNDLLVCVFSQRQAAAATGTLSLPDGLTQQGFWRPTSGTTGYPLLLATAQLGSGARTAAFTSTSNDATATWCSVAFTVPSGAPAVTSTASPGDAPGSAGGFLPFYPVGSGAAVAPVIPTASGTASGLWSFAGAAVGTRPAGAGSPTGGSGGPLTDRTSVGYNNGTKTSTYHIYAAGLDWTKRVGLIVYGDGSGEFGLANPTNTYLLAGTNGLIAVAKQHNMVLVTPRAPGNGCTDGDGVCWYLNSNDGTTRAQKTKWLDDLITTQVLPLYNIDKTRVCIAGFSSGAENTAGIYGPAYAASWMVDGLLLAISYGSSPSQYGVTSTYTAAFKQNVAAVWDVYEDDETTAVEDSLDGYQWYGSNGFTTRERVVRPGGQHVRTGEYGGLVDEYVTEYVIPTTG